MRDPIEVGGYTIVYYQSGQSLKLPLSVYDQVSSMFREVKPGERKIWDGLDLSGCSIMIDLATLDTVGECTAAEVARMDELEAQRKVEGSD
jgi:hypothetical protein